MMTFVMFFIVGPVEEFEFRAFTHDQSQRVLPKWAALIFSSVFFGLSHIPIAIFIYMPQYNLNVTDLIFMEISWMAAGATFGALYMWSRNIFAVIVMHGIGNWQLSVFLIRGRSTLEGLTGFNYYLSDLSISIFANGLMILVFFLIHKYYWEPQRRGEAAFGGKLVKIQQALFSHDTARKNTGLTGGILAAVTIVVLVILFSISAGLGAKSYDNLMAQTLDDETGGEFDLTTYSTSTSQNMSSDYLNVGDSMIYSYISTSDQIIKKLSVRLTWQDETDKPGRPTIRRYTNQPDTFRVAINGINMTVEDTVENPVEGQGSINLVFEVNDTIILDTQGEYIIDVEVFMEDAGMWSGLALLGWSDAGNAYDLAVETTLLENPNMMNDEGEEMPEDEQPTFIL
jgi:membrane protease YdiL (CAAX protease family)